MVILRIYWYELLEPGISECDALEYEAHYCCMYNSCVACRRPPFSLEGPADSLVPNKSHRSCTLAESELGQRPCSRLSREGGHAASQYDQVMVIKNILSRYTADARSITRSLPRHSTRVCINL